jgi:hypothetical protein
LGNYFLALFGSHFLLLAIGPLAGLPASVLAIVGYAKCRYGGGRFGPLWLEMVDMMVLLGNAAAFVVSCALLVQQWLA